MPRFTVLLLGLLSLLLAACSSGLTEEEIRTIVREETAAITTNGRVQTGVDANGEVRLELAVDDAGNGNVRVIDGAEVLKVELGVSETDHGAV